MTSLVIEPVTFWLVAQRLNSATNKHCVRKGIFAFILVKWKSDTTTDILMNAAMLEVAR
jgi:hypothetical protein